MTDTPVARTADPRACPHGVDPQMAHCCVCADPAFHAAQQPAVTVHTMTIGGAPRACPSNPDDGHWPDQNAETRKRLRAIEAAGIALIADVRRRYPGEALRCPYMIALDEALQHVK